MKHIKVTFTLDGHTHADVLIALLSGIGFDGFEETDQALLAYTEEENYDKQLLNDIAMKQDVVYETEVIEPQNWNAIWESNFQPVIVDDFCTLRAHFHDMEVTTPHEIVITPKMSFGTGHHATTQLMIMGMKNMPFAGKTVLDFGTGTGILAILAEKLGALKITAIDNDSWSVENTIENAARNNSDNIVVKESTLEQMGDETYDVILANINRHILLRYMSQLYKRINAGGAILMSGLLCEDKEIIVKAAQEAGFQYRQLSEKNNWIAIFFDK